MLGENPRQPEDTAAVEATWRVFIRDTKEKFLAGTEQHLPENGRHHPQLHQHDCTMEQDEDELKYNGGLYDDWNQRGGAMDGLEA